MSLLYILNYIDRQNIAAAKLQGIMDDLDMSVEQFATALSILYVGYLPFQLPSNLLLSRLSRPGLCASESDFTYRRANGQIYALLRSLGDWSALVRRLSRRTRVCWWCGCFWAWQRRFSIPE